jgi:hypothetical protein
MKACLDCKHYRRGESATPWSAMIPRSCVKGLSVEMEVWWAANSSKTRADITEDMPCFEQTEHDRLLDSLIQTAQMCLHAVSAVELKDKS